MNFQFGLNNLHAGWLKKRKKGKVDHTVLSEELFSFYLHVLIAHACVCVCASPLISYHMLGDRVKIGREKRKINDLRGECIAAFTH